MTPLPSPAVRLATAGLLSDWGTLREEDKEVGCPISSSTSPVVGMGVYLCMCSAARACSVLLMHARAVMSCMALPTRSAPIATGKLGQPQVPQLDVPLGIKEYVGRF